MAESPKIAAGWYPDPEGSAQSRWWDGTEWTNSFEVPYSLQNSAVAVVDSPARVYNAWIWLVVLLPYITLPLLFAMDYSSIFDPTVPTSSTSAQLALMTSPAYILSILLSFLAWGLGVLFAYRDSKALEGQGVVRPFHWAWNFIPSYPVYAIGRVVIVHRRTRRGMGVLWVTIGMFVLAIVVTTVWVSMLFLTMMQEFSTLYPY